jgi:hypothetical protein
MKKVITETIIEHPMENVLDIPPGTTVVTKHELVPTELVIHEQYDHKDNEIETQLENIYTAAMTEFEAQAGNAELAEGKYKARNAEVAVQYLNAALSAVREKSVLKQHKDKLTVVRAAGAARTVNNNLVVASHNDILRMLQKKEDDE